VPATLARHLPIAICFVISHGVANQVTLLSKEAPQRIDWAGEYLAVSCRQTQNHFHSSTMTGQSQPQREDEKPRTVAAQYSTSASVQQYKL
jgi:hypothetical protein